jgi:ABC-type transporter MlaC component
MPQGNLAAMPQGYRGIQMTKYLFIVALAVAAFFGSATHALPAELHSLQAEYAHVTSSISSVHAEIGRDAKTADAGMSALEQTPADLNAATTAMQQAGQPGS